MNIQAFLAIQAIHTISSNKGTHLKDLPTCIFLIHRVDKNSQTLTPLQNIGANSAKEANADGFFIAQVLHGFLYITLSQDAVKCSFFECSLEDPYDFKQIDFDPNMSH
jgi:hypothetical protein